MQLHYCCSLEMALTTAVGIFRPISIGFQGEYTGSAFKLRGIVILLVVSVKPLISRCFLPET